MSNRVSHVSLALHHFPWKVVFFFFLRLRRENQIKIKLLNVYIHTHIQSSFFSTLTNMKSVTSKDALCARVVVCLNEVCFCHLCVYQTNERTNRSDYWVWWVNARNTNSLTDENECEPANIPLTFITCDSWGTLRGSRSRTNPTPHLLLFDLNIEMENVMWTPGIFRTNINGFDFSSRIIC